LVERGASFSIVVAGIVAGCAAAACATVTAPSRVEIPVTVIQEEGWIEVDGRRYQAPAIVTLPSPREPTRIVAGAPGHQAVSMLLSPEFLWRSLLLFPLGPAVDLATGNAWRLSEDPLELDLRGRTWTRRGRRYQEAYPTTWVATLALAFPATGLGVGRSFGDWRVHGSIGGLPVPISGVGAALEVSRGFRLGPLTISPGLAAGGVTSDHCSWGGCGEPFWFHGIGPQLGLEWWFRVGTLDASLGAAGGAFVATGRSPNMHPVQPHVTLLRFGLGW
jgi:hypothetical protein